MAYFAVTRRRGAAWDWSRPMEEQAEWAAHADFMEALVADGFVVLGGPLGDRKRVLLVVNAASEETVLERLAENPWMPMGLLEPLSVEPWEIRLDGRDTVA
jgi:uncharacterized protein YciI